MLGINAQYVINNKVVIRTLGVKCIICANGSNMITTVRELKEELNVESQSNMDLGNDTMDTLHQSNLVRCAVHTMQLPVMDHFNLKNNFSLIRSLI